MQRKAWSVATAVFISIVAMLGAGIVWFRDVADPGRWDEVLLGPASERRLLVMAEEGFSVDLPSEWRVT